MSFMVVHVLVGIGTPTFDSRMSYSSELSISIVSAAYKLHGGGLPGLANILESSLLVGSLVGIS